MLSPKLFAQELMLFVGETATLPAPIKAEVRIGSKKILRAVDEGERIRLIGMKAGETSVMVGKKSFKVIVTEGNQKVFLRELRLLLKEKMGLSLSLPNGQIEVRGQLLRFSDWQDIAVLARRLNGRYTFLAKPLKDVAEQAMLHLNGLAEKQKWPRFQLALEPQIIAQLPAGTQSLKTQVERALSPFGIQVEVDNSQIELQPLVRTRVILAEVSKEFSQDIGIQWPGQYQAQIVPKWQNPSAILLNLRAMESKGLGKVLAAPNLVCRSGSEAAFHAGGEFPIRVFNRMSKDVVWKKHGVILNVKPKADFKGRISLEVETEISLLDNAHAVDGIPAMKTNRVKSHFDLTGSKTIALSGLIRQDWGQNREGLIGLSGIPVLGALFGSQKFLNSQTELVIFVTPEIASADGDEAQMPEGWNDESL